MDELHDLSFDLDDLSAAYARLQAQIATVQADTIERCAAICDRVAQRWDEAAEQANTTNGWVSCRAVSDEMWSVAEVLRALKIDRGNQ